jgi:phosphate starvation-inducible PhoH-like protein
MMSPVERSLDFDDAERLRELAGELGAHWKVVSRALGVDVSQRGLRVRVAGPADAVDDAERLLRALDQLVGRGWHLRVGDVESAARLVRTTPDLDLGAWFSDAVFSTPGRKPVVPRTPRQREYVLAMRANAVTLGVGPAGTGKTFLAVAMAAAALRRNEVRRIILTRPAVEAGEKLGYLPGDLAEKVNPYLRPLFDALQALLGDEQVARLIEKGVIEIAPLAFMRGRTLSEAYVLLDEAQNTTVAQMRMFLTRLGEGSRMVVNGDVTQIDLPRGTPSGLIDAMRVLRGVDGVGLVEFNSVDVIRHPMVAAIIDAYEADDRRRRGPDDRRGGAEEEGTR